MATDGRSITEGMLEFKDTVSLTERILEKARGTPEEVVMVLADVLIEEEAGPTPGIEQARIVFLECITPGLELTANLDRMVRNLVGGQSEEPFRRLLGNFNELLDLPKEEQARIIKGHYSQLPDKAAFINSALESLKH